MDITLLVQSFIFLIIMLAILMVFLFVSKKVKQDKIKAQNKPVLEEIITIELLRDKLKNKKLSAKELSQTVELILERFGKIKDFEIYIDIILRMIHHPKVNKDIVISFEKRLSKLNPDYAETIAHNVTLALNSRRY